MENVTKVVSVAAVKQSKVVVAAAQHDPVTNVRVSDHAFALLHQPFANLKA